MNFGRLPKLIGFGKKLIKSDLPILFSRVVDPFEPVCMIGLTLYSSFYELISLILLENNSRSFLILGLSSILMGRYDAI